MVEELIAGRMAAELIAGRMEPDETRGANPAE
jgi:hypothetical protein